MGVASTSQNWRTCFARSMRAAVMETIDTSAGACAYYAAAATLGLQLLGETAYTLTTGAIWLPISPPGPDGFCDVLEMDPAVTGHSGREFHAWSATADGAILDLAWGDWPAAAARTGNRWTLPPPPPFIWTDVSGLGAMGVRVRADVRATAAVRAAIWDDPDELAKVKAATRRGLAAFRAARSSI